MRIVLAFLIGMVIGLSISILRMSDNPKGISKLCDDIGYLSTSCKDVDVLPYEYKDKDVAKETANRSESNNTTINNTEIIENEKDSKIVVRSWLESDE